MDELRHLFSLIGGARERLEKLRSVRLKTIEEGRTLVDLPNTHTDRLVLHIAPLSSQTTPFIGDIMWASTHSELLRPPGAEGYSPGFNADGFANIRAGSPSYGYTQLHRDGIIEAVKARVLGEYEGRTVVPAQAVQRLLFDTVPIYLDALRGAGFSPPFFVMATLQNVSGATVACGQADEFIDFPPPLRNVDLVLPTCVIQDFGAARDYREALRPALDALWNAGGRAEWAGTIP